MGRESESLCRKDLCQFFALEPRGFPGYVAGNPTHPMCALVDLLLIPFFFLMIAGIGVAATVLWIWMLIDCAANEPSEGMDKLVWVLVILFTHLLGALIYLLVRRPERRRLYGR